MMNNINWESYWYAILLITTIYYLIVFIIYFKQEIAQSISSKRTRNNTSSSDRYYNNNPNIPSVSLKNAMPLTAESDEAIFAASVNSFLDEINAYFSASATKPCIKEIIINDICRICKKYPTIKRKGQEDALKKQILMASEFNCAVTLSEDDLERVWES